MVEKSNVFVESVIELFYIILYDNDWKTPKSKLLKKNLRIKV